MKIVPLELSLPDGPATLKIGSLKKGQPQYERDGQLLDVDVTIPDDLVAAGWIWHGSTLYRREPGDELRGVGVDTRTFPPPQCFEQARAINQMRAELDGSIRPAPAKQRQQHAVVEPAAVSEQLEMELV